MNCHKCGKWIDLEWDDKTEAEKFQAEMDAANVVAICIDCYIPEAEETDTEEDLVYRLRKRAEIRRQIPGRKSVQEGKPDRLADLLDEAADEIERLEKDSIELSWVNSPDRMGK